MDTRCWSNETILGRFVSFPLPRSWHEDWSRLWERVRITSPNIFTGVRGNSGSQISCPRDRNQPRVPALYRPHRNLSRASSAHKIARIVALPAADPDVTDQSGASIVRNRPHPTLCSLNSTASHARNSGKQKETQSEVEYPTQVHTVPP